MDVKEWPSVSILPVWDFPMQDLESHIPWLIHLDVYKRQVYYGTTPQKKIEAQIIRKNLRKNLSKFKEYVREYQEAEDAVEKDDIGELLKRELNNSSEFTAFKRWLIWDNEMFSEIEKYIPKKD